MSYGGQHRKRERIWEKDKWCYSTWLEKRRKEKKRKTIYIYKHKPHILIRRRLKEKVAIQHLITMLTEGTTENKKI
jgi:hypothetical protein